MSNHAHGPWEIEYDDLTEEWIVSWETGSAEVGGLYAADQVRLIAAAPDLLAELEYKYEQGKCGCGHPACDRCKDDLYTLSVIKRAKGETE